MIDLQVHENHISKSAKKEVIRQYSGHISQEMDNFPQDIIERILHMREIYIVIRSKPCYELSTWNILGFYNTLKEAQEKIVTFVLAKYIDKTLYDPTKRFWQTQPSKNIWIDRWQNTIGIDDYSIEIWKPSVEHPSQTIYFNIDVYIKTYIIENRLSSDAVMHLFEKWKESPHLEELYSCFSPEQCRTCPKVDCKDWYGHVST